MGNRHRTESPTTRPKGLRVTDCVTGCGKPTRDTLLLCDSCIWQLEADLGSIPQLVYQLNLTITRQSRLGGRNGSRATTLALPYDQRASDCLNSLRWVLIGWVRVLAKDDRAFYPVSDKILTVAAWLRFRTDLIAVHEAAGDLWLEITDATHRGRLAVDAPRQRVYAGPCWAKDPRTGLECLEHLYARPGAAHVACRACGTVHDVEKRKEAMRASLHGMLMTTWEIARLAGYFDGIPAEKTFNLLTTWAAKGRIVPAGRNRAGRALYPFGETIAKVLTTRQAA